ncbi:short-chain dehydrogenase, putative [Talaromyces stipitatus ATCC 10500]|uniref:Short-chain dehydrogenase, putative n=1 Tax=Talaromyces stipitatus (strain ATCC 10500 / CBS 375.48 / QM 6759 / NRRL 1006) TaxID=441959 RepID=B8MNM6_TALSN|nr:short-chain dehydrogenase, putative [Talaromyces stipitatus ATCC 10500]EED14115.1 short-chain dehydrogenase, putative [Talaromyces stipitatus ATCC 10500]
MSSPIALILGAGARVGQAVGHKFAANGYEVALASRSSNTGQGQDGLHYFKVDFSDPANVKTLFESVVASLGVPSVVVYNAYSMIPAKEPFSITPENFQQSLNVNMTSVFAAAHEAVNGFEKIPTSVPKSFIFTGNALDEIIIPGLSGLGAGKSATAHLIKAAAAAYLEKGYTFYYVDERLSGGGPVGNSIDGPAHADLFYELAGDKNQRNWKQMFVKGKGFVRF